MQVAWNSDVLNNVQRAADDDCRNAAVFQITGNQTHGLVADRSQGNEDCDIHLVFVHEVNNGGRVFFNGLSLTVGGGD